MPLFPLFLLAALSLFPWCGHSQPLVQTGRYTAVTAVPTDAQRDPLQTMVTIEFPAEIETIGQAVNHALADTGYALTEVLHWQVGVFELVRHPLPAIQRQLGPLTVLDVLKTLVGPAFEVVVDPVHRRVAFERHHQPEASKVTPTSEPEYR